ncbi:MAG: hypothetical protein J6L98_02665 [Bacteroidales bacterium]|nr:hypothetical protein [Bacteroidales bacterium]
MSSATLSRRLAIIVLTAVLSLCSTTRAFAQTVGIAPDNETVLAPFSPADEAAFKQPEKVFYPETWFHFIGGNVSKEGIDADLQAIAAAKISGVQWFHGYFGGPWPATGHQLTTLSPEWEEMVGYLGRKAKELGLRLTVQTCPGWSMAGGPWIQPENAMRTLVWSRTDIPAGQKVSDALPKGDTLTEAWKDYRDITVLAFPSPLGDTGKALLPENINGPEEWKNLLTGLGSSNVQLKPGTTTTVTFTLPKGEVIRTIELPPVGAFSHNFCYDPGIHVKLTGKVAGEDKVLADADFPMSNWQDGGANNMVFACNEAEGVEQYTFTLTNAHPASVRFVRFWSAARKNSWRGEAGWTLIAKEPFQQHTEQNPLAFVKTSDIIDISGNMTADGHLDWTAPATDSPQGTWTILRIGHVNAGKRNSPAPPEATGWECSKFDPKGAEIQFANYVGMLKDGPLKDSANGMLMDSWECNTQTWTDTMEEDFKATSGYSLIGRLPALMGYVLDSQEETSRFLIDWRRTVNKLYCENFFKKMTDLAHAKGMEVQFETAGSDVVTMDPMEYFKYADVPMCEFWQPFSEGYVGDLDFKPIHPTASAAHIYGKPRVASESFTSFSLTWDEHWQMLKEVANFNMAQGVTHNVFHTYTHNPQIGFLPPGTSFANNIGTPFLRGQTWWKYMDHFTTYLARTSYLLERGRPVASVLWYLGDEVGHKPSQYTGSGKRQSGEIRFPAGFNYDYCNPDALLTRMSVKDGKIVTPEGVEYEVLWIPENERMLPATIEKIGELLRAGAKVIASAPVSVATLKAGEKELFDKAVESVWGGTSKGKVSKIGKGRLAVGMSLDEAIKAFGMKPHLDDGGAEILWSERVIDGARWYYIGAPVGEAFDGTIRLEGKGKAEWWDPVSGTVKSLKTKGWGRMKKVHLLLAQAESGFVVFRNGASNPSVKEKAFAPKPSAGKIAVEGWTVSFPEGWGTPKEPLAIGELKPWKDLPLGDEGRTFSGTATYEATFSIDKNMVGKDLVLDLGKVDFIADVKVNGKSAGVRWTEPYSLNIKDFVKEGENTLSIDVTSTWYNRLVYDASLPEAERKTWTIAGPAAGRELHDSGLLGPVVVEY